MSVSSVSVKGQITLPARLRSKLGIKPHDQVVIESTDDAIVIRRAPDFFELEGFLGKALPREVEQERMMQAVAGRHKGRRR